MQAGTSRESDPEPLSNKTLTKRTISLFEELSDQRHHIKGVFELFESYQKLADLNREAIDAAEQGFQVRFSALEQRYEATEKRCEALAAENTSLKARVAFLELAHHFDKKEDAADGKIPSGQNDATTRP